MLSRGSSHAHSLERWHQPQRSGVQPRTAAKWLPPVTRPRTLIGVRWVLPTAAAAARSASAKHASAFCVIVALPTLPVTCLPGTCGGSERSASCQGAGPLCAPRHTAAAAAAAAVAVDITRGSASGLLPARPAPACQLTPQTPSQRQCAASVPGRPPPWLLGWRSTCSARSALRGRLQV